MTKNMTKQLTKILMNEAVPHNPVMLPQMLEQLSPRGAEHYLDCTFGAGGYSEAILRSAPCQLTALDQDPAALKFAQNLSAKYPGKFNFIHTNFGDYAANENSPKYNGIVMDLGVSSMQLDQGERGFSFMHDGPLDMRMSSAGQTAADFINEAEEEIIANVIYKYGEEISSRKIARNIVAARSLGPITTTLQLAQIVRSTIGFRKGKIDSATKTFQGLRIYINNELGALEQFLEGVQNILMPGGRLVIVSFHSLEDSIVKNFFKANSAKIVARSKYAKAPAIEDSCKWLKILTKKPMVPDSSEVRLNPRCRSAKLRAAIKIGGENVH